MGIEVTPDSTTNYTLIQKRDTYLPVWNNLQEFLNQLNSTQKDWLAAIFHDVLGKRLGYEGYVDCSLYINYVIPKQVYLVELRQWGSPVYHLYRMRKSVEDSTLAAVFGEFWIQWESASEELSEKEKQAVLYWFFTRYSSSAKKRSSLLVALVEVFCPLEPDDVWNFSNNILYNALKSSVIFVDSLEGYVEEIAGFQKDCAPRKLYYRGHASLNYDLLPGIKRLEGWDRNEDRMYHELLIRCPNDFKKCKSHLDYLVEMQHYGLPTRLLDITETPMVALYFACCGEKNQLGEVILFPAEQKAVKYFHSDTVAVLAALSTRPWDYKEDLRNSIEAGDKSQTHMLLNQLAREIKSKNPAFEPEILPEDVQRNLFVSPVKSNQRIIKQEGAFIICGLNVGGMKENSLRGLRLLDGDGKQVVCVIQNKEQILSQLDQFGINQASLFPEIDLVTGYIKSRYGK